MKQHHLLIVVALLFSFIAVFSASSTSALAKDKNVVVIDAPVVHASSNITGCWQCAYSPSKTCCVQGEFCPGNVPCCATEPNTAVACETSCNPQCAGKQCGNGGCPMLPGSTCGTCEGGQECNATSGMCVAAPQCFACFSGECCAAGQMCPDGNSCCDCGETSCDCKHECTPKCNGATCGTGGCPSNDENCGKCSFGSTCSNNFNCQCRQSCSCGDAGSGCGSCPSYSGGCAKSGQQECTCLGPSGDYQEVFAKSFVYQTTQMYEFGCTPPAIQCGGFAPINSSTSVPYALSYQGEKSYAQSIGLYVIFESPNGKPLPGSHIYLNLGNNSSVDNCCYDDATARLPFFVSMTNCTQQEYFYCFNLGGENCFTREDPITQGKCGYVGSDSQKAVLGNGAGAWFENPKTSVFTVLIYVSDYYYTCPSCGNSAGGSIYPGGISIQYILE